MYYFSITGRVLTGWVKFALCQIFGPSFHGRVRFVLFYYYGSGFDKVVLLCMTLKFDVYRVELSLCKIPKTYARELAIGSEMSLLLHEASVLTEH